MKNQKGFSLVELLVVVIIIAIIAAIAIPNLLASRRAANESSAINSLRTIHSAQATYFATTGANLGYGTHVALGTDQLIDTVLGGATQPAVKSGYSVSGSILAASSGVSAAFCAAAVPSSTGLTGTGIRSFAVGVPGVLYGSAVAANIPTCTTGALAINGAAVIQ